MFAVLKSLLLALVLAFLLPYLRPWLLRLIPASATLAPAVSHNARRFEHRAGYQWLLKAIAVALLLLYSYRALFAPVTSTAFELVVGSIVVLLPAAYLLLHARYAHLVVDDEGVALRAWFGLQKMIRWDDLHSVTLDRGGLILWSASSRVSIRVSVLTCADYCQLVQLLAANEAPHEQEEAWQALLARCARASG